MADGGDGLQKLTEYLSQTRRQAEISIQCLSDRIKILEQDCEEYKSAAIKLDEEKEYYQKLCEQLKLENSRKSRLQERDDWKALVDSAQKDRDRLHEECMRLEAALVNANAYIEQQEALLVQSHGVLVGEESSSNGDLYNGDVIVNKKLQIRQHNDNDISDFGSKIDTYDEKATQSSGLSQFSPLYALEAVGTNGNGNGHAEGALEQREFQLELARLAAQVLRVETERVMQRSESSLQSTDREAERQCSQTERASLLAEISRLRTQAQRCTCGAFPNTEFPVAVPSTPAAQQAASVDHENQRGQSSSAASTSKSAPASIGRGSGPTSASAVSSGPWDPLSALSSLLFGGDHGSRIIEGQVTKV